MKLIDVTQVVKLKTLRGNPYFDDLPESVLKDIAAHTQLREYERGDVLFWESDPHVQACISLKVEVLSSIEFLHKVVNTLSV